MSSEAVVFAKRKDAGLGTKGRKIQLNVNAFEVKKWEAFTVQHCEMLRLNLIRIC